MGTGTSERKQERSAGDEVITKRVAVMTPGPRLNIRKDVFPKDLVKSRSHEIGTFNCRIALKCIAAEVPVKFQSDRTILNTNLAASRLYEILRKDVFSDIIKVLGVITNDRSDTHAKGQGDRSKVKFTELKKSLILTQIGRFRTITPVWIYQWLWNDSRSTIKEVPYCFSRSFVKFQGHTGQTIAHFDPNLAFPDCNSILNSQMAMKWCTKLEVP